MDRGEVLAEAAPAGADGDDVRNPGTRRTQTAELGPRILDGAHRADRGERHSDVAVQALGLFESTHVEHQLTAVNLKVGHAGRV